MLIIKADKNTLTVIAKCGDKIAEHEIQLKLVLGYYWQNELPVIDKLLELFVTVIKRAVSQIFHHKKLLINYTLESNDNFENSSYFEINISKVKADDVELELLGDVITFEGIDGRNTISKVTSFRRKDKKTIEKEIISS
ncbi:hypothetical protein MBCUT_16220 [Methanobrevibacter cuticularis]|uniref:Uncharacterized protein n=2 Tax=Methanobrevibacter cuticularis TaxID=47311 RepID=A0A166D3P2_9EURY|nr:hypothetical protein MBCUT_16220 [Methanobrevibacter cuticularis]